MEEERVAESSSLQTSKNMPGPLLPSPSPQFRASITGKPIYLLCSVYLSFKAQLRIDLLQEAFLEQSSCRNNPPNSCRPHCTCPSCVLAGSRLALSLLWSVNFCKGEDNPDCTDSQLRGRHGAGCLQSTISPSRNCFRMGKLRYAGIK